jgi:hypothetical protein
LKKTVGIQALFDVLRVLVTTTPVTSSSFSLDKLTERLRAAQNIDPDGTKYEASGIGRSAIRKDILVALGIA